MPSENELYLWWSGSSESVFLYYLTGAMTISFLTTILITKSLRRVESRVIELLYEDNGRDVLVTYLLKVTTSIMPGSGCPTLLKIFMQLKGEKEASEFFQLRSKSCGKALFQRGQTDIFMVTVPDKIGDVKSVELLVSGLREDLPWKIEDVQLYDPVSRVKKHLPVTFTTLEVLNLKSEVFSAPTTSWKFSIIRNLLRYHQWMAMFGNTVRIGAFSEIAHVLCVFMALFTLMILSQIFYIILPRGEFIPSPDDGQDKDDEVDPGMFNINIQSLAFASAITSVSCFALILGLEILLRSVKSLQLDPGNAYYNVCQNKTNKLESPGKTNIYLQAYNASAFFLPSCNFFDNRFRNFVDGKPGTAEHHPEYIPLFAQFLRKEYEKYSQQVTKENDNRKDLNKVSSTSELPQWVMKHSEQTLEEDDSQCTFHEIELVQQTSTNLSQLLSTISLEQESDEWSYFDRMKNRRASQDFANDESYSDLEQVVIELPECNDSKIHMFIHEELDGSKAHEDMDTDKNVDSDVSKEILNKSKNTTANILEGTERLIEGISSFNRELNELKLKNSVSQAWHDECVQKNLDQNIVLDWENLLKTWSRELVKDFCDIIKYIRENLILKKLDISEITLMLLKNTQDVLQRLVIACYMQRSKILYDALNTDEATKLLTHLSMEIMVTAFQEIFVMLMKKGNVCLVDLILRSHRIMHMLQYATRILWHALSNDLKVLDYIRYLNLAHSMHQLLTVILHGCFDLVTTYNFVPWHDLKTLVERKLKDHLEETCYHDLLQYVQFNIQNAAMEDIAVKRLCASVEEHAKQEIWEDLHNEKKFFTNALIKCQVINTLNLKISKLKKQKEKFDHDNKLFPKEQKTRLQLLAEKRKPKTEDEMMKQTIGCGKHARPTENLDEINQDQFERLEKQSKEIGQTIDNLFIIRDRLKKVLCKQGWTKKLDGAHLLSQAMLHPCVNNLPGDSDSTEEQTATGKYKFANFLQFKRTEAALTHFFQDTASELMQYLLKTVMSQFDLKSLSEDEMEQAVMDILVKLDTLVDFFYEDLDNVMRQCIITERCSHKSKNDEINAAIKRSALSLIEKSSLIHWSALDLSHVTASEMSVLQSEFNEFDEFEIEEILQYIKEGAMQTKEKEIDVNENAVITDEDTDQIATDDPVHTDDDDGEIKVVDEKHKKPNEFIDRENEDGETINSHTPTYTIQDIIKDLWPVKTVLELMKQEEEVRSDVTMIRYINRSKRMREHLCTLQVDNIVDAYHMLDEGDDSHTLTSAGLYQLEHDCMGEDLKPLPPWVKMMTLTLVVILLILITVYVTVIGGQFSTTDLQEWMCYYLLSILFFACVLEPIRACIVGWCMTIVEHKLNCNRANQAKLNVTC